MAMAPTLLAAAMRGADPSARRFFVAAGITDPTQRAAVNALVVSLKAANLWNSLFAVYPFVGGSAASHKFNLKDPRDADAAYRIVFTGTWTHNANGITGNGADTSGDTKFLANNALLTATSGSFGLYSRTDSVDAGWDLTAIGGGLSALALRQSPTATIYEYSSGTFPTVVLATTSGFYQVNRNGATNTELYKAGALVASAATVVTLEAVPYVIGAYNAGPILWTSRNYAFAFIGAGMTAPQAASLSTIVQQFQTTLGRQV